MRMQGRRYNVKIRGVRKYALVKVLVVVRHDLGCSHPHVLRGLAGLEAKWILELNRSKLNPVLSEEEISN